MPDPLNPEPEPVIPTTPPSLPDKSKEEETKRNQSLADARNAVGGQAASVQGHPSPPSDTVSSEALKESKQPLAPEHPLEVPEDKEEPEPEPAPETDPLNPKP